MSSLTGADGRIVDGRMAKKRIIVFRFDRNPLVCRSRVSLLRRLNPGVPICGVFGGAGGIKSAAFRLGSKHALGLDVVHSSHRRGRWNWRNGDLVLAAWYRDVGRWMDFEIAHFIEWDLLLLEPLHTLYASVPDTAVGLTAVTPLSAVEHFWGWLQDAVSRHEWQRLLAYARAEWGYDGIPHACLAGGSCFPRSFLEQYSSMDLPELCHDELRLPLFAQILGFPIVDTDLRGPWHGTQEDPFFNLESCEIEPDAIQAELAKPGGRRAFHPVRFKYDQSGDP